MAGKITSETRIRVRYADTDKMGIVYYANYLVYFEVGRTEFIRQYYKSYSDIEEKGYILPALKASVNYKTSATYDDELIIKTTLAKYTRLRLNFEYEIFKYDGRLICTGSTEHCFTDINGKPRKMPNELWELLQKLNCGAI